MNDIEQRIRSSFASQGLMATLGATIAQVADGEVRITLPFSRSLSQQHGFLHAGAITSIVDSACGYAALTQIAAGFEVVTAEFKLNLLRPAIGEHFEAVGKVVNAGKRLVVCTGEVHAFQGESRKLIAIMQATLTAVAPVA